MIRKQFLTNPNYPSFLIYGGLLLIFLRTPAAVYDIAATGSFLSGVLLGMGIIFIVSGLSMRFYQAKQSGTLKNLFLAMGLGIVAVVIMMVNGIISTPAFLLNIF